MKSCTVIVTGAGGMNTERKVKKMRPIDADVLKKRVKESTAILSVKVLAATLVNTAPTIDAVPVSELLSLRDNLYEDNLITMRGLRDLNMLIAKYEGGKDRGTNN